MGARRCGMCALNWPVSWSGTCPECDQPLLWLTNAEAMSDTEMRSRVAHAKFRRYLDAETDEQRLRRQQRFEDELAARFADQLAQL